MLRRRANPERHLGFDITGTLWTVSDVYGSRDGAEITKKRPTNCRDIDEDIHEYPQKYPQQYLVR